MGTDEAPVPQEGHPQACFVDTGCLAIPAKLTNYEQPAPSSLWSNSVEDEKDGKYLVTML